MESITVISHETHGISDRWWLDFLFNNLFQLTWKKSHKALQHWLIMTEIHPDSPHKEPVLHLHGRHHNAGIILCILPTNERRRNIITHWLGIYTIWSLIMLGWNDAMGCITLVAITWSMIILPHFQVKLLQLISRSGTHRWNLWIPHFQMSCSDLTWLRGCQVSNPSCGHQVTCLSTKG